MKTKQTIRITVILLGLFLSINTLYGQISQGGTPYSFKSRLKSTADKDTITLSKKIPSIEMPKLKKSQIDSIKEKNKKGLEIFQFAYSFKANIDVKKSAVVDSLESGLLYRLSILSREAHSINLIFKKYHIPPGAKLFLYNQNKNDVKGAFTSNNNKPYKSLALLPIKGEKIIIEFFEPYFPKYKSELIIGKVSHDFLDLYGEDDDFGNSESCEVDINCSEGDNWQDEKHAVCKIIIDGSGLCTGSLMNNTSFNGTPYFLTANHCICNQNNAENSVYIFNYESPTCNGSDGSISQSISGADLRATRAESDFTLLELSKTPISTYNPYYNGWDRTNTQSANGVCIHHPMGDVKKISTYNITPTTSNCMNFNYNGGCGTSYYPNDNFWLIQPWLQTSNGWGVTEGGSSGSPLYNNNHHVIGQLFGSGDCDNTNCSDPSNDYSNYGKIFSSWNAEASANERLSDWLDPQGDDVHTLDGSGICSEGVELNLNITQEIKAGTTEIFKAINTIEATNTIKAGATATYEAGEKIVLKPGFHAESGSNFTARIVSMNCVDGCYPINLVAWTSSVTEGEDLCYNVSNASNFDISIYTIAGSLVHQNSGDISGNSVCVWNTSGVATGIYLATVSFSNDCQEISNSYKLFVAASDKKSTKSLKIKEEISTESLDDTAKNKNDDFSIEVFPNPNDGSFSINIKSKNLNPYSIEIINSNGVVVYKAEHLNVNRIRINQSGLPKGFYYIRIIKGINIASEKIIIN